MARMPSSETLTKGARITGDQRGTLAGQLAERYTAGESIRAIAEATGRSYGFVHGVLKEAGTALRGRGGATRGPATVKAVPTAVTPAVTGGKKAKKKESAKPAGAKGRDKKPGKKGVKKG